MSKQTEALKLALEALEYIDLTDNDRDFLQPHECYMLDEAITAIREALAEQPAQQEPVAWRWTESNGRHWFDWRTDWTHHDRAKAMGFAIEYAYTSPPASKPWVRLTQQDIDIAFDDTQEGGGFDDFARAIEAKLKEKNT